MTYIRIDNRAYMCYNVCEGRGPCENRRFDVFVKRFNVKGVMMDKEEIEFLVKYLTVYYLSPDITSVLGLVWAMAQAALHLVHLVCILGSHLSEMKK